MMKKKQIFLNLLKGHDPRNPKLEVQKKENSLNKNLKLLQYRYKKTNTIMMKLIITTTVRIIEVNLEDVDLTEAKIQVNFLRGQNSCGRGQCNQNPYQGQYQNTSYQGSNYQGN